MDTSKLCMYCMQDNGGEDICPHCGKDAKASLLKGHLAPGEILGGRFLVGRAVGQDASGIVYIVFDLRKERSMRIREYMPRTLCQRVDGSNELKPLPGMEEAYTEGLNDTRAKAESAEDPEKAMPCFEENGTIYVVLRRRKAASAPAAAAVEEKPVKVKKKPARPKNEDEGESAEDESTDEEDDEDDEDEDDEDEEPGFLRAHWISIVCMVVVVGLLAGAVVFIMNRNKDASDATYQAVSATQEAWVVPTSEPSTSGDATGEQGGDIVPPEQSWQYAEGGNTIENTAVPTDAPTAEPVDDELEATAEPVENTSELVVPLPETSLPPIQISRQTEGEVIVNLQQRLIDLGWLDLDKPTGNLGDMTRNAIRHFQEVLRSRYDREIETDGIAGPATIAWLNSEYAPWNPDKEGMPALPESVPNPRITATPTVEPTVTPEITQEAVVTPEPTATPVPSPTPFAASPELISEVQTRLVNLGWLDVSQQTGVYDNATQLAVQDFQRYINSLYEDANLPEDGNADANTTNWLSWDGAPQRPATLEFTQAPVATATAAPATVYSETIDETSPVDAITWLQSRLIELQWLKGAPNGSYDPNTRAAVTKLQNYLNQQYTLTLEANGTAGNATLSYLNSDYNNITNPDPGSAPELSAAGTYGSDPLQNITAGPDEIPVTTETDKDTIIAVKRALIDLKWLPAAENAEITGEYDETMIDAVAALKAYLATSWDATLWGAHDGLFDMDGNYIDWPTLRVIFDTNAPVNKDA